jgi:nucleotide-binding universal stress UspA family protein
VAQPPHPAKNIKAGDFHASRLPSDDDAARYSAFMPGSTPYKTVGVASTFSPRFVHVLAEAKRIRDRFDAELDLIYVGDRTDETVHRFGDVLGQLNLPLDSRIYYESGDPADSILTAIRKHKVDLIVAGALEKEVVFHPFLGDVARRLVREAVSSVMLFTHPETDPKPVRRIVFVTDDSYSEKAVAALQLVFHLAAAEEVEKLFVIRVVTTFEEARASRKSRKQGSAVPDNQSEAEAALEKFVLSAGQTDVPIEIRYIRGNTGLAAADFVQSVEANLLVVSLPLPSGGETGLPPNLAWLTDVIPCNLWVIR